MDFIILKKKFKRFRRKEKTNFIANMDEQAANVSFCNPL